MAAILLYIQQTKVKCDFMPTQKYAHGVPPTYLYIELLDLFGVTCTYKPAASKANLKL